MTAMSANDPIQAMLGQARYQVYQHEAGGDADQTTRLYLWGVDLAGAWHSHLSHIEIAVRNAMDRELRSWNANQQNTNGVLYTEEWTAENNAAPALYNILKGKLTGARKDAKKAAQRRHPNHPRYSHQPNHDDVVAQLMLGAWTHLLEEPGSQTGGPDREDLWTDCLRHAFPGANQGPQGRQEVGSSLEVLRVLRNRVAHHENLLTVNTLTRLNESLALLQKVSPGIPDIVMRRNRLRALHHEGQELRV